MKHDDVVKQFLKTKADPLLRGLAPLVALHHTPHSHWGRAAGATSEETEYLELRTHCGNPGCAGWGLKGCNRRKRIRYCCVYCQRAHWPKHKPECKKAVPKAVSKKIDKKVETTTKKKKKARAAVSSCSESLLKATHVIQLSGT